MAVQDSEAVPLHIKRSQQPDECPISGCDESRYSRIGMEYHLIRSHDY